MGLMHDDYVVVGTLPSQSRGQPKSVEMVCNSGGTQTRGASVDSYDVVTE